MTRPKIGRLDVGSVTVHIQPKRTIEGISAVLLPFTKTGRPDYDALAAHIARTSRAGLIPAVNMDTGYVNLLTPKQRVEVLLVTSATLNGGTFVAGAFVEGSRGELVGRYRREIEAIEALGGTPIIFQCSELTAKAGKALIALYRAIATGNSASRAGEASRGRGLLLFELGQQFASFGRIYDLETVRRIMEIEAFVGMKHSSLDRQLEWQRLDLRDKVRPDFKIYTGNDLAIDMVMYGSDYLLGLSTFSPEAFALRDQFWVKGDARFYPLNDLLQYLGFFAFRPPIPAYKHSAAQFLKIMGNIPADSPPPKASRRPDSDRAILADIAKRVKRWLDA